MRKGLHIIVAVTALLLFSCKKERSFDPDNTGTGGGGSTSGLLTKSVFHILGDSITAAFSYDAQKRLFSVHYTGEVDGEEIDEQLKFVRNAQGIIQKAVLKTPDYVVAGIDSAEYILNYNSTTSRYTSRVMTIDFFGSIIRDSIAFTYNSSGKISQEEQLYDEGNGYEKLSRVEYTYDAGGNLTKAKVYLFDDASGSYIASEQDVYEYDNKISPFNLGIEAFLMGDATLVSKNNIIKDTYTDLEDASNNDVGTTVYLYNAANKPKSSTMIYQAEGIPYLTNYYYQ